METEIPNNNPLLAAWTLPPFGSFNDSHFAPAMDEALRLAREETDAIASASETPTFANTIEALDRCGQTLDRVESVFFNLLGVESNPEREKLAEKFAPMLSRHHSDTMLNARLFARVKHVWDNPPHGLSPEQHTLLETTYRAFVRSGALLDDGRKAQLRQVSERLSRLSVDFSNHLLHALHAFSLNVTDAAKVEGVPATALAAAQAAASAAGHQGWDFTLDAPVYGPFMAYCSDRELRRTLYMARNTACMPQSEYNNLGVCEDIVNLRLERARLLGYACYADYVLERRMAGNAGAVERLLGSIADAYMPQARREVEAVEQFARRTEGAQFALQPWDFAYYSRLLKQSLYDIDGEMLRPYFELAKVEAGIFGLARELYGVTFTLNGSAPVYHPDVKVYDVADADGTFLGTLYIDFFPRHGKQSGAWTTSYSPQWRDGGRNVRPVVGISMNLTPPSAGRPSLLTFGEVTTFLHEFGHSLHALFADTVYRSLSGTSVFWDFVELPSQIMENFATEKKFLRKFAKHYATGEPLPDALADKLLESRNFNVAYAAIRQVSFGLLDMALHTLRQPLAAGTLMQAELGATAAVRLLPEAPGTGTAVHFSHIMDGGYAAGYYSYKWAEVLDADAFQAFKDDGVFSPRVARRFRECILSRGGTEPPQLLYRRFRGAEPTIEAMMRRDGINISK